MSVRFDTHELAWAAGFFDGEGWCSSKSNPGQKGLNMGVVQAKDKHVIDRFQNAVLGLGTRSYRERPEANLLPQWKWHTQRFEHLQAVTALLWKWLSPVSRKKIADGFQLVRSNGGYQQRPGWCSKGHQLVGENVYVKPSTGQRSCQTCRRATSKLYRTRLKEAV